MRLHNRQIKATFWNDPDLLQWPRDKRWFYMGLIQLADDSGCLEDSPFAFKINLFPSPLDSDITTDLLADWRDELIRDNKMVRYEVNGKQYLYLVNFRKHQSIKNPNKPSAPLPEWVKWEPYKSNENTGKYLVSNDVLTKFLGVSYKVLPTGTGIKPEYNLNNQKDLFGESGVSGDAEPEPPEPPVEPDETNFNFPQEYWDKVKQIDTLPENKQLDMLVVEYGKKYPAQRKKFGTGGVIKARESFKKALDLDIPASDILKEILFDTLDEGEPEPKPWEITGFLIQCRGLEQTRAQMNYEMARQLEREVIPHEQRNPP